VLLDDLNQCIYYGYGQVITYNRLDELYESSFSSPLFKDLPMKIFDYDSLIEKISAIEFILKRMKGGDS
jgi:hypothetical protein